VALFDREPSGGLPQGALPARRIRRIFLRHLTHAAEHCSLVTTNQTLCRGLPTGFVTGTFTTQLIICRISSAFQCATLCGAVAVFGRRLAMDQHQALVIVDQQIVRTKIGHDLTSSRAGWSPGVGLRTWLSRLRLLRRGLNQRGLAAARFPSDICAEWDAGSRSRTNPRRLTC
jgi:hypothetical protein